MNNKNWIIQIAILAVAIAALVLSLSKNDKQAYVDTGVLMGKYKGMIAARAEIDKKQAIMKANTDTLIMQWEQELKTYEKERAGMSKKERELKEQLLRNKQQQLGGYQQAMQKKAQEEEQSIQQTPINEINDYLKTYGKKNGYSFIFGATGAGNLLYANEAHNITEEILEALNAEYDKLQGGN